ncbi:mycofactocin biosynthesis chaperone MftB [Williamsia phyllosphaerae]|uniref:Mycofactocin system protein MftB n=1 Tax=Williamsia phyllosphaerae TaxID=885042 RepID=A0ABQ1UPX9_9NOCA|nr:mycofactocin biosynthesis chaperone MftB [Williamsia phyllosphaerae]GGF24307.1 mycofactocin system protein MftB [Williamsia phyllosphaerae]
MPTAVTVDDVDLNGSWTLNPSVVLRPEPFGALLYHFGTRKLSFLKNLIVVDLVRSLADHSSAHAALAASGIGVADRPMYLDALRSLARSETIIPTPVP